MSNVVTTQTSRWIERPAPTADPRTTSNHHKVGITLALLGMAAVLVATGGSFSAATDVATDPAAAANNRAWAFGLTVTGFATVKLAIAVVLTGIVVRLWYRVESVKHALERFTGGNPPDESPGPFTSPFGAGKATTSQPESLRIHRMARTMWLPMLVMGAMAVVAGLIASIVAAGEAGETFRQASAWSQGLTFLGETFLLSGISLLLGTILGGLREGGGEVQAATGLTVKTLDMPTSARAFMVLMATGMMIGIVQFVLYANLAISFAGDAASFAGWAAWLGPFREAGLGILLSGIVLALYTISKVLGFQFARIRGVVATTS